jgi:hypothetical protein
MLFRLQRSPMKCLNRGMVDQMLTRLNQMLLYIILTPTESYVYNKLIYISPCDSFGVEQKDDIVFL